MMIRVAHGRGSAVIIADDGDTGAGFIWICSDAIDHLRALGYVSAFLALLDDIPARPHPHTIQGEIDVDYC